MNQVKVVVWDLDNTVWEGTLLENDRLTPRAPVLELIDRLDRAGILQSVASRSDESAVEAALVSNGLDHYFVFPQVSWADKSTSIQLLASELNLGLESFAFVDDDAFERAQVLSALPQVRVFDSQSQSLTSDLMANIAPVSSLSGSRRELYRTEERRNQAEAASGLSKEQFLASLEMKMTLRRADESDIARIIELMARTNQLNTTGVVLSIERLREFLHDEGRAVIVASMEDRFGTHGTVGLSVMEAVDGALRMNVLLTSCRVANRGAGSLLLRALVRIAADEDTVVNCDFVANERNRQMAIALRFCGLVDVGECSEHRGCRIFALAPGAPLPSYPPHIEVVSEIFETLTPRATGVSNRD